LRACALPHSPFPIPHSQKALSPWENFKTDLLPLNLLEKIYGRITIPQAVYNEIAGLGYVVPGTIEVQTLPWIKTEIVTNRSLVAELQTELDEGESEAIVLAMEFAATRLLLDDLEARIVASRYSLNITGVLGIILVAKSRGLRLFGTNYAKLLISETGNGKQATDLGLFLY